MSQTSPLRGRKVWKRRNPVVTARSGEGLLTEPTAVGRQSWQHIPTDRVFGERRRIPPEAQALQPSAMSTASPRLRVPPVASLSDERKRGKSEFGANVTEPGIDPMGWPPLLRSTRFGHVISGRRMAARGMRTRSRRYG